MKMFNYRITTSAVTGAFLASFGNVAGGADLPPVQPPADPYGQASSLPAVSQFNFKISPYLGYQEDTLVDGGLYGLDATVAFPLGHSFGAELEGQIAGADGDFFGRAHGQVFWRNPATGLLGVYGSYEAFDDYDYDAWRLAAVGEAYLDQLTMAAMIGYEDEDTPNGSRDGVFGLAEIGYYATDDLLFTVGYRHMYDINIGAAAIEYQLQNSVFGAGTSLFAEGRIGEDNYAAVWGGIRMYFGTGEKSLIRRHREDDQIRIKAKIENVEEIHDDKCDKDCSPE